MPVNNITAPRIALGGITLAVLASAFYYLNRDEASAATQATDDAYVAADMTLIAPQVQGQISRVLVEDNQPVSPGTPLVEIDDRDFRIALAQAQAGVAAASADVANLQAQLDKQSSSLAQASAALQASSASLQLAQAESSRFAHLAADGSGSVQAQQQAAAQLSIQQANHQRDQATLQAVRQQTRVLQAELDKAKAGLAKARTLQDSAALNLARTHISAPVAGVITQREARTGALASIGKPLMVVVPLQSLYVEANFRETQLANLRVGQPVSLQVDALPHSKLRGHIASIAPASGASLSPLPAHNATGNFTKIVQRLPVRIALDAGQPQLQALRVGMSVHPEIQTHS
ncbi:membrane fusion component of tripartite multidrug resistance system [Aquitalea magnusonii]|uniref:Membrane fusion component of tripartite multidrug resistance system n=1 Tax=Aquitalea magnusonii TaxID=332411 RepID=A0A3G9GC67_9NEIS|nr:HlyD family secretion protein [Aquitalea magnusonii]BBF84954.1 membrane fusion component of tripartite multidrug resistance system [Aquitalea magnusonii]